VAPRVFNITVPAGNVRLGKDRKGDVRFTVTNDSDRPQRSLAKIVPLEGAKPEWFAVGGELERDLPVQGVQQYVVTITVPKGIPEGTGKLRLDAVSAIKDGESVAEGPTVVFEIPKEDKPINPIPWILAGAAVVLVVVGVVLYLALQPKVPNVVGKSIAEARSALGEKKLVARIDEYTYQEGFGESTVVVQVPGAGAKPPDNDSVAVSLSVQTVVIPSFQGQDVTAAALVLHDMFLKPTAQARSTSDQAEGTVVETQPAASSVAHRGDPVTIYFAVKPPPPNGGFHPFDVNKFWKIKMAQLPKQQQKKLSKVPVGFHP
jgi:hypothetical protein